MTSKHAWPMLALALNACSSVRDRPQPLAAVAEQRLCPPLAQPPARLVVPPKKTDFLVADALDCDRAGDPARRADQMGQGAGGRRHRGQNRTAVVIA